MVLDSDRPEYGGHGRLVPDQEHFTLRSDGEADACDRLSLYLPARTALVLEILRKPSATPSPTTRPWWGIRP